MNTMRDHLLFIAPQAGKLNPDTGLILRDPIYFPCVVLTNKGHDTMPRDCGIWLRYVWLVMIWKEPPPQEALLFNRHLGTFGDN